MTVLPAAGPDAKAADLQALMTDAEYFSGELVQRLEALHRLQGRNRVWPLAAVLSRRIRAAVRAERRAKGDGA